jgi:acetoin utilization deacetylase AcuC-like enzyme
MGFCLFNNVAVAARTAVAELGVSRALIVDFDIHHGNGTQETFWTDGTVGFVSIHRWPFFPGTGAADETGSGDGLGATLNLPVGPGTPAAVYRETFIGGLERMAERLRPELVLVSAGFDAHAADPVGDLELATADFTAMTRAIVDVAGVFAGGRVVSVLEGGYHPEALADCALEHLGVLAGERRGAPAEPR